MILIHLGDVLGFVGQIVSSKITSDAMKDVADQQIQALERQRQFIFENLAPEIVGPAATKADIANVKARLKLQYETDPDLFSTRYSSQANIKKLAAELGKTPSEVADVAAKEAIAGVPGMTDAKKQLVDAALKELSLGATLPPDVQAELVKAGLEKSGMVTGAASPKGVGGLLTRQLIGSAGIQLQQQRQQNAANLLGSAQQLETSRQQILGTLFPNLATTQLNVLRGQQGVLEQSNQIMAPAGLTGKDVANLWLARVGASTQLAQQQAQIGAQGGFNAAAAWGQGIGAATQYASNAVPTTAQWINAGNRSRNEADFNEQYGSGGTASSSKYIYPAG